MQNSILILCMLSSTSYCFSETSFFLSFFFKANFAILLACLPIIFSIMMFLWSLVIILSFWRNTPSFYIFLSFSSGQTDQKSCPVHKHSSEEYEEDWPIIMSIQMSTLRPRVLRAQRESSLTHDILVLLRALLPLSGRLIPVSADGNPGRECVKKKIGYGHEKATISLTIWTL